MTANKRILNHKLEAIVAEYSENENISLRDALDVFYKSDLYKLVIGGVSDMHCRSNAYLAEELKLELIRKKEEQNQIDEKSKKGDIAFFMTLFKKDVYRTLISLPHYVKEKTGQKCTPFKFIKFAAKSDIDDFEGFLSLLNNHITRLIKFGVTIPEIAENISADREDLRMFYEKYYLKT